MKLFTEYRYGCPQCGCTHFHKRHGFHFLAKYKCHKCKSTFRSPKQMKQFTSKTESTNIINRHNKSTIRHGKTFF